MCAGMRKVRAARERAWAWFPTITINDALLPITTVGL
jgi:hypothetical protein